MMIMMHNYRGGGDFENSSPSRSEREATSVRVSAEEKSDMFAATKASE